MKIVMASMLACGALTTALAFNTTYAQDAEQRPGVAPGVTLPTAPDFASKFTDAMKTPEALAAGEAALKATADAYAGATAIEDTLTMTVSMGERKETQAFTIARDATGMRLNLQSIVITATGEKIFIETEEVADKYVGFAIEESMLATLTTKLPGFELPFPRMLVDSKATAGARMQGAFLSEPTLAAYDAATNALYFTSTGGSDAIISIDPKTRFLASAAYGFTPPGAPEGFKVPITVTFAPITMATLSSPIAFVAGSRKEVDSIEKLAPTPFEIGSSVPNATFKNFDGTEITLASLRGKVVVMDMWATWCGPCRKGLPSIGKFAALVKDDAKIAVFGVNTLENVKGDEQMALAKKFWEDQKFAFPCIVDDGSFFKTFGVGGIPLTIVIGPDGTLAAKHEGIDPKNIDGIIMLLKTECDIALGRAVAAPVAPADATPAVAPAGM